MMKKRLLLCFGAIAIASATGIAFWVGGGNSKQVAAESRLAIVPKPGNLSRTQIEKLGIRTEAVLASSENALGTVPGTVTLPPEARVAVTAPFTGSIIRLYVVAGQAVTRGQPLAVLRSREPVQIGAELARARGRLGLAQAAAARTGQLAREGIIAAARSDEAQAAVRQAQVDVAENSRVLAQSGAGGSGELVLRAPITGRLALVNVQTGGPVDGMTAPFVVESTANLMLDLQLPERLANDVYPGMQVELPVPSGSPVTGSIISVGSSIDPMTRSVLAKARLGAAPTLVSGKTVTVTLKGASQTPGISVAAAAVTKMADKDVVFVRTTTGFARRDVTRLGQAGDRVILSGGLVAGEQVAVSGISELKVILGGE